MPRKQAWVENSSVMSDWLDAILHAARRGKLLIAGFVHRGSGLIRMRLSSAEGGWFDLTRRVETGGFIQLHTLTLNSIAKSGFDYLATRPTRARQMFRALPVRDYSDYAFIDLGSGKGRMLFLAAEHPFLRITGVEFAVELHQRTLRNIERYNRFK